MYYKDLLEEALRVNLQLKAEITTMLDVNKKYAFNEDKVKEAEREE